MNKIAQFPIVTQVLTTKRLFLADPELFPSKSILWRSIDQTREIIGSSNDWPTLATEHKFSYNGPKDYRFGCRTGSFEEYELDAGIALLSGAAPVMRPAFIGIQHPTNTVFRSLADQSPSFYITDGPEPLALLKSSFSYGELPATTPLAFSEYVPTLVRFKSWDLGETEGVLASLLKTKDIIRFIETPDSVSNVLTMRVETREQRTLVLTPDSKNTLWINDDKTKAIVGKEMPTLSSFDFRYHSVDHYSFGCGEGKFNKTQLAAAIAQMSDGTMPTRRALVTSGGAGRVFRMTVLEESENYYIVDDGTARPKAEYGAADVPVDPIFEVRDDDEIGKRVYARGYNLHATPEQVLTKLLEAQEIIDFIESE